MWKKLGSERKKLAFLIWRNLMSLEQLGYPTLTLLIWRSCYFKLKDSDEWNLVESKVELEREYKNWKVEAISIRIFKE